MLECARQAVCAFIFDREILDRLPDPADGGSIHPCQRGRVAAVPAARDEIVRLAGELQAEAVFFNHDDPAALARDAAVEAALRKRGIAVHHTKDAVVFEREEVLTSGCTPFSVFTPYKKCLAEKLTPHDLQAYPVEAYADRLAARSTAIPDLRDMGFVPINLRELKVMSGMSDGARLFDDFLDRIDRYRDARDFPAVKRPSYLPVHLRFGTVSIRQLAAAVWQQGSLGRLRCPALIPHLQPDDARPPGAFIRR